MSSKNKKWDSQGFLRLVDCLANHNRFMGLITVQPHDEKQLSVIIHQEASRVDYLLSSAKSLDHLKSCINQPCISNSGSESVMCLRPLLRSQAGPAKRSERRRRQHASYRLGMNMPDLLPQLPVIPLRRLAIPYSPHQYIILENRNEPIPSNPILQDRICGTCTNYHILNPGLLSATCQMNESAIYIDDITQEPIAIIMRNFIKEKRGYFNHLQSWAVTTVRDSINRRFLTLRNCPGRMARFRVTPGRRDRPLFGWA